MNTTPTPAGCVAFGLRPVTIAAAVLMALIAFVGDARACSGCGCRGGPGYRGPDGKCVGWTNIGRVCGSPPTQNCRAEGPNEGADVAAEHGVKALDARRPRSLPPITRP